MNYNNLMKEKARNFYDYILEIVPKEKHDKIISFDKICDNIYLIFLFINRDNIDKEIDKLAQFYGIPEITNEQHSKIKQYMEFFLDIKNKLFTGDKNDAEEIP